MRELGKHDEADRQEWSAAGERRVDHRQHPVGVGAHRRPVERVGEIGLAGGGGVADEIHPGCLPGQRAADGCGPRLSWTVIVWFARTLVSVSLRPLGQSTSTRSAAAADPSPNVSGSWLCDRWLEPLLTRRDTVAPPALTVTRAPIPSRFDSVPVVFT